MKTLYDNFNFNEGRKYINLKGHLRWEKYLDEALRQAIKEPNKWSSRKLAELIQVRQPIDTRLDININTFRNRISRDLRIKPYLLNRGKQMPISNCQKRKRLQKE